MVPKAAEKDAAEDEVQGVTLPLEILIMCPQFSPHIFIYYCTEMTNFSIRLAQLAGLPRNLI